MQKQKDKKQNIRLQIMKSAIKSFKIEGIDIPLKKAKSSLEKVEVMLGK